MQIIKENEANIAEIVKVLNSGGLVIFPSETVYGAAVDATNPKAVKKLSAYKQRPLGKPYSVMVANREMAEKVVVINETAENIYRNMLPGPITVVSRGRHLLAPGIESETGSLGVRIPNYPFLLSLISTFGKPLTATSANASYKKRPYKIDDVLKNISKKQMDLISLVIDAGELPRNEPSTVIDTTYDDVTVLRQGQVAFGSENKILSRSEEETKNFGKELWQKYEPYINKRAVVFALEGQMGAGKTQFAKGLAKAMGIDDEVVSPTFNLQLEYNSPEKNIRMVHFDAWRMQNGDELEDLGIDELIKQRSVVVVEWADKVADKIRAFEEEAVIVWVKIEYDQNSSENCQIEDERRFITWKSI